MLCNYDVKLPNFTCYRERKQTTKNLNISLKKSALGEFANTWQSEQVEVIALKFQRTQSDFLSDIFNGVADVWHLELSIYRTTSVVPRKRKTYARRWEAFSPFTPIRPAHAHLLYCAVYEIFACE